MIEMIFQGMKRRKKEIRYVSVVTFVAVLFMTGITLFQNIMNNYVFSTNLNNYGDWVVSTVGRRCEHPYLLTESWCKTGVSLVNEEGKVNELFAGTVDDNFKKVYASVLYEGRIPKTDEEVAMDVSALAMLGYSYDLGQTVTVSYYEKDGNVQQKDYKLVGILRNFSSMWITDGTYVLPNFLVTEQEFETYKSYPATDANGKEIIKTKPDSYTTYFYQLNPEYEEINTYEFATSFTLANGELEMLQPMTYNRYVYENRLWGSPQMFENVTTAMMVIAALAIGYLLTAYTGKRRATYYRYRCIGANITQVRGIVAMECLYATIPQIILGMVFAYVLAAVSCEFTKDVEYIFDGVLFIKQIFTAFIVIFLAIVFTQLTIRDKRLASNANVVKPTKYKKLRRQAKRTSCPEKKLFQRQRALRPLQDIISVALSIVVGACLVLCVFKIYDSVKHTLYIYETRIDFKMSYEDLEEYYYESGSNEYILYKDTFQPDDLALGVDEAFVEAVRTAPGVKDVKLSWVDEVHYFKWDGMENSEILQFLKKKQVHHVPFEYDMELDFYDTLEDLKEEITEEHMALIEASKEFSWEKVEKGEQIILYIGTVYATYHNMEEQLHYLNDTTIKAGDTIYIKHFEEEYEIPIEVGAVVYDDSYLDQSYSFLACRPLAERIVETEGETLRYNRLEITYDSHSSYESTDKQLAALAVNHGMKYTSQAEQRRTATNELIQNIGIYGVLFLLIVSVYIILQNSFLSSKRKYMQESYSILKRIGMEDTQYIKSAFLTEMKSFLWLYGGLIFGYLLIFCDRYIVNLTGGTAEEYILEFAVLETRNVEHWYFIGMVTLLYLVMLGNSAVVIRKSLDFGTQ